jgi:tRNA nucleotidyltransferase (CCA-adding enzyme)
MRTYLVGGAVRDELLGIEPSDRDYVVTEVTHDDLIRRGFFKVGQSFQIYLHPKTKEEYTLASNLEDDLRRRDLTINAMAMDEQGTLIDPFGGLVDLEKKLLRHVDEQNFKDDPVRILRLARFASVFSEFTISPETFAMIYRLGPALDLSSLIKDRFFLELRKAIEGDHGERFFKTLIDLNVLDFFYPELLSLKAHFTSWEKVYRKANVLSRNIHLRASVLGFVLPGELIGKFSSTYHVPNEVKEALLLVSRNKDFLRSHFDSHKLLDFFYQNDLYRNPQNLQTLFFLDRLLEGESRFKFISQCFEATQEISFADVDPQLKGKEIGEAIKNLRLARMKTLFCGPTR